MSGKRFPQPGGGRGGLRVLKYAIELISREGASTYELR